MTTCDGPKFLLLNKDTIIFEFIQIISEQQKLINRIIVLPMRMKLGGKFASGLEDVDVGERGGSCSH